MIPVFLCVFFYINYMYDDVMVNHALRSFDSRHTSGRVTSDIFISHVFQILSTSQMRTLRAIRMAHPGFPRRQHDLS